MPTWSHTYIEKSPEVSKAEIERFIRSEPDDRCSLAKQNKRFHIRERLDAPWLQVTPNGFLSASDSCAESCRKMSERFQCRVIMTHGQGNCSGMVFGLFDRGRIVRILSAVDGMWCDNIGEPQDWETEVFGDLSTPSTSVSEYTLKDVAQVYRLPGYDTNPQSDYWSEVQEVSLSMPPPLP